MSRSEDCLRIFSYDERLWEEGLCFAGIDEAGRGPLAGCVMAACVVMPRSPRIHRVYDSKGISERRREELFDEISLHALFVGTGRAEAQEIDAMNILQATRLAMRRAAKEAPTGMFLIDAVTNIGLKGEERPIIRGDSSSYSIAAASIIAKVTRDREMRRLDERYPAYGFSRHKGYGTKAHMDAIRAFGPCPEHRLSFLGGILNR